ncbi:MAG: DUF5615 family PIN-like protein [Planctomycetaceae bacterium]|nr:DUF5615 family PIN-like protein [Planctomycetaceae bacterium]
MKIVAHESVAAGIVLRLRQDGIDVISIAELSPGIDDDSVMNEANTNAAVLLTADKDFGELVDRLGRVHHGIVPVRLSGLPPESKPDLVGDAVAEHQHELAGSFTVISPGAIRVRRALP